MHEPPRSSPPPRPTLPWVLFAVASLIAVLATTGFVYLLAKRTEAPAQVLRRFYQGVHNGDCEVVELLTADLRAELEHEQWCSAIQRARYPATVEVESVTLLGDEANVAVREPDGLRLTWPMRRAGRSWRVASFPLRADLRG